MTRLPAGIWVTVVEHIRVSRQSASLVAAGSPPALLPHNTSTCMFRNARRWRYLSPAIRPNPNGGSEFHVRWFPVAGGNAIVG